MPKKRQVQTTFQIDISSSYEPYENEKRNKWFEKQIIKSLKDNLKESLTAENSERWFFEETEEDTIEHYFHSKAKIKRIK